MNRPSDLATVDQSGGAASIAEKATIPSENEPWFLRLKNTALVHDPKATVSYVVARDGETVAHAGFDPESLRKVRDDFTAGTVLQDRYRLMRELGRGGMGVVFLGRDQRLDRQVAVKVILSPAEASTAMATMDSRLRSSFAEEARLGASLTHPAIATVFDYGFHHDSPFTVFEYIEGEPLRDLVERRGRLPLDEVRLIVGPLAQALDFAHGRRIVHRDLKPENIRATEQRQFKILDLGLAREFNRQEDWRFAGTPAYASPEQAAEHPSDGRTDQYSLAVIVFELLTGRRPFESDSWVELLGKHFSEPPPSPRSLVSDLPQSVEAAILRGLEKDPNRRFSSCSELAVALGCQFLSGPAPLPEILMETELKRMGGRWKAYLYPFNLRRPRTHLALAPDALWGMHRAELMRWPLFAVSDLRNTGFRKLSFRLLGVKGRDIQWFLFYTRKDRRYWQSAIESRIAAERHAHLTERQSSAAVPAPAQSKDDPISELSFDPRIEPVLLLKSRPGTRFQLLGMVEAKARDRRGASAGLAIRGSMMGADAVVDLTEERLPGFWRTDHRAGGMAVRAVDEESRLELKTRWFSSQIGQVAMIMFAVTMIELVVNLIAVASARSFTTVSGAMAAVCFASLATGLAFWQWPQLVRPTALCFLAKVVKTVVSLVTSAVNSSIVGFTMATAIPATDELPYVAAIGGGVTAAVMFIFSALFSASMLVFFLYLGRRAWRIDQEYRSLASQALSVNKVPASRLWMGRVAWAAAVFYAAVLLGGSAVGLYTAIVAVAKMPKTSAVVTTETGEKVTVNPMEWNSLAWKMATDQDPAAQNPAEAVKVAERAVGADPKNGMYLNTLGVARYRAKDFSGAIEALNSSILARGLNAEDAFFLAMAHARLGRQAEAKEWYRKANQHLQDTQANNSEVRRFREEAAAVLEALDDRPLGAAPTPSAPAAAKDASATKPK